MTKFKLSYFDVYGRGELIRLVFAAAKVEYEDHRFSFEEWPKIKPNMPFGQCPVLFIDGIPLAQSGAIVRYISTLYGFTGKNSYDAAYCEMVATTLEENLAKMPFMEKDLKIKEEKSKAVWKESVLPVLQKIENHFSKKDKKFLCGEKLSYADLLLMQILLMAKKDMVTTLPALCALRDRAKEEDGVKEYLANRPDRPF